MKFTCKKFFFQSLRTKNEVFKVQGRKLNFMQSLETKTIFKNPIFLYKRLWGNWVALKE